MRSLGVRLLSLACLLFATACTIPAAAPPLPAPTTFVSLTFDDGQSSQYAAAQLMKERGIVGTFYINSGLVGSSTYYMPWWQVYRIADAGNEIGGHTTHHADLTKANAATVRAEICDDRIALLNQGFFPVAAFAYPANGPTPEAKKIVTECGYTSARGGVGGLYSKGCPLCPAAETLPPADPYEFKTEFGAGATTTLADLQDVVTHAESKGGGWVTLAFHGICDNKCTADLSVPTATFTALLDWLAPRSSNGTIVRTVSQTMSGDPVMQPPPTRLLTCTP
jgi:peptidoglycan/xylan/chitin deacetylase (PgdA/CDA1 family)